jgi:hypothetical protein
MNIEFITKVTVKLDGRAVGTIKPVSRNDGVVVWSYFPKCAKIVGKQYPTLEACMNSLKG